MPQSRPVVHSPSLETLNWLDTDDARALRLLSRLQSNNKALEGLSRALEVDDLSSVGAVQRELT